MERPRINIAALMGLVVLAAIGLAALRDRSAMLANLAFCLALGLNFGSVVVAIAWPNRGRFIAAGYAACGWGYFVLVSIIPEIDAFVKDHLITTRFLKWVSSANGPSPGSYQLIVHCLFDIAVGLAGALLAWSLVTRIADPAWPTTSTTGQP